ncbi:MAG: serine/threonine-protein kinase [Myxococcota bacterium]
MSDDTSIAQIFARDERPEDGLADEILRQRVGARLFHRRQRSEVTLGRFVLRGKLGEGGGGIVYEAEDPELGRRVAIKVFGAAARGSESRSLPGRAAALRAEARTLARLSHPNIVRVFEIDEHEGDLFIVMERIEGTDLSRWLTEHGSSGAVESRVRLLHGIALGLRAAHRLGIVHGDVKPSNILVDREGQARLVDFGLATVADKETGAAHEPTVAGTPAYMAPELHQGAPASVRADIYAFCVTAVEVLTGRRPSPPEPGARVRRGEAFDDDALWRRMVPGRLRATLCRGLCPDPDRRLTTMEPLVEVLGRRAGLGVGRVVAIVGATAVAITVTTGGRHRDPCQPGPEQIEQVWGDSQRLTIRASLEATGLEFAPDAADRTVERIDAYAQRWARQVEAACARAGERRDDAHYRRAACLNRSLAAMASLVEVLQSADPRVAESATEAATALPPLETCLEPAPSPQGPTPLGGTLLIELARARMKVRAGAFRSALPILQELADRSHEAEPAVRAEVLIAKAEAEIALGRLEQARASLESAFEEATVADHPVLTVEVAAALTSLVGYQLQHFEGGRAWARVASAGAARLPQESEVHRSVLSARASLLFRQGRFEDARPLLEEVRDRIRAKGPPWPPALVLTLNDLAVIDLSQGEYEAAAEGLREASARGGEVLGPSHPALAEIDFNLARLEWLHGRDSEARRLMERALTIALAARGPMHDAVAMPHAFLAELDLYDGRIDRARQRLAHAHRILTTIHPEGTIDLAVVYRLQGELALRNGDVETAVQRLRRAVEVVEQWAVAEHPRMPRPLEALGRALHAAGRGDEALVVLERAEALMRAQRPGTAMPWVVALSRAAVLRDAGRWGEAEAIARPALAQLARCEGQLVRSALAAWQVGAQPPRGPTGDPDAASP